MVSRVSSWFFAFLLICASLSSGALAQSPDINTADLNKKDLPNFHKVDEHYFRGGQPTETGFRQLAKMGVHLVIDLRDDAGERDEWEKGLVSELGMQYVNVSISTFRSPDESQVRHIFNILHENQNLPVFVHCMFGDDRTGLISGLYRIEFYNWTADEAYKEMRENGFSILLLRRGMKSYLFKYAKRKADDTAQGDLNKASAKTSATMAGQKTE